MDQGWEPSMSSPTALVTAELEVCVESLDRHRHAVQAALQARPHELCLDFTGTRLFGSDGVRLLAETAVCCHCLGVELRVLEGAAASRILDLVGLHGYDEWLARGYDQAAHQPTRTSKFAFAYAVRSMTTDQLACARCACTTPATHRDGRSRLRAISREQRRRQQAAPTAHAGLQPRTAG